MGSRLRRVKMRELINMMIVLPTREIVEVWRDPRCGMGSGRMASVDECGA